MITKLVCMLMILFFTLLFTLVCPSKALSILYLSGVLDLICSFNLDKSVFKRITRKHNPNITTTPLTTSLSKKFHLLNIYELQLSTTCHGPYTLPTSHLRLYQSKYSYREILNHVQPKLPVN